MVVYWMEDGIVRRKESSAEFAVHKCPGAEICYRYSDVFGYWLFSVNMIWLECRNGPPKEIELAHLLEN